jgi:hypothetical protein
MKNSVIIKKSLFVISVAMIYGSGTVSCSKAHNCHCVYKTNGVIDHEDNNMINEGKKSKTEASCNQGDKSTSSTVGSTTYVSTTECELTN